ncbi:hypothetical protein [Bradyrhizobium uaiense]|uniref:Uncharacterized protein n=1 Tax=Bradyrhizobium uaiense TaxID=2594946 RepID=A0A6P1B8S4_9BRAD|nr:hypothetical protein [Bradyrhizobium uaiense]NEU94704.1 hypothetical protein [Bradyrhizobium uaiense]
MPFKLALMAGTPGGRAVELDYKDMGARFGVSRTHVQKIVQDAARGTGRGDRLWQTFRRADAGDQAGSLYRREHVRA